MDSGEHWALWSHPGGGSGSGGAVSRGLLGEGFQNLEIAEAAGWGAGRAKRTPTSLPQVAGCGSVVILVELVQVISEPGETKSLG